MLTLIFATKPCIRSMNLLLKPVIKYSSRDDKQAFTRHKYSHSMK